MRKPQVAAEPEWITKEDAAKFLNVKPRQIEKRAKANFIRKQYLPRLSNQSAARVLYSKDDVDALLAGAPNMHGEAIAENRELPPPNGTALARIPSQKNDHPMPLSLRELELEFWDHRGTSPANPRAWLTLAEAAEHSGLSEETIAAQISVGNIDAVDRNGHDACVTGPQRRHLRVKRASLDAYGEVKP